MREVVGDLFACGLIHIFILRGKVSSVKKRVTAVLLVSAILTALKLLTMRDAHWYNRLAFVGRWIVGEGVENHYPGKHRIHFDTRLFYYRASIGELGRQFTFARFAA